MTAPALRPTGQAAAQVELLARLGLPASASPEDVDDLHQAVSDYLAAAPLHIRGWARAQVSALDATYLQLTDPVGLPGSALKSPTRPPAVVPGGPATPPARRGPAPAVLAPVSVDEDELEATDAGFDPDLDPDLALAAGAEPSPDELAALYAMVTPSAHDDMKPRAVPAAAAPARATRRVARPASGATAARARIAPVAAAPAAEDGNIWKRLFLGVTGIAAAAAILFGANALINGGPGSGTGTPAQAQASAVAPTVDLNKVGELMTAYQADPKDIDTLMALGNEYYAGMEYETAASWFDRILAIDADNIKGMLARGAVSFNLGKTDEATATWERVLELDPENVEAYYDLGFVAFYQAQPDYAAVQRYWGKVIELDPESDMGKQAQTHLDALTMKSLIPAASAGASGAPSAAPSGSAAGSPAASDPASPAASPAASTVP